MFNGFTGFGTPSKSTSKTSTKKPITSSPTNTKKKRIETDDAEIVDAQRRKERAKRRRLKEERKQELERKLKTHKQELGLEEDFSVPAQPSPSTSITVRRSTESLTQKEAKREGKDISSQFNEHVTQALALLDDPENAEGAQSVIYKGLLQTLVDLVPILEHNIRKTKGNRGSYQLVQVVSQLRECMADIQAIKDKSNMGTSIVDRHVRPVLYDIAGQVSIAMVHLEAIAKNEMNPQSFQKYSAELQNLRIQVSNYMSMAIGNLLKNINQALS
jgi:hypothetical protein